MHAHTIGPLRVLCVCVYPMVQIRRCSKLNSHDCYPHHRYGCKLGAKIETVQVESNKLIWEGSKVYDISGDTDTFRYQLCLVTHTHMAVRENRE